MIFLEVFMVCFSGGIKRVKMPQRGIVPHLIVPPGVILPWLQKAVRGLFE